MGNMQSNNNSNGKGNNLLFPETQMSTLPNEQERKSWLSPDQANPLRPKSTGKILRNGGDNSKIDQNIREGSPAGRRGNPIGPHKLNVKDDVKKDNVGVSEIERIDSEEPSQLSASEASNYFENSHNEQLFKGPRMRKELKQAASPRSSAGKGKLFKPSKTVMFEDYGGRGKRILLAY